MYAVTFRPSYYAGVAHSATGRWPTSMTVRPCKCSLLYGFTCVIKRLICDQLNALIMWKTYELIEESTYFVMIPIWDMWDYKLAEIQRVINCYYGRKTLYVSLSWVSDNIYRIGLQNSAKKIPVHVSTLLFASVMKKSSLCFEHKALVTSAMRKH